MRLTILGPLYAMPENRVKWQRFAELYPDSDVTLLVPDRLDRSRYGGPARHLLQPEGHGNYHLMVVRRSDRLRGIYLQSGRILKKTRPDVFAIFHEIQDWATTEALVWRRLWAPRALVLAGTTQNIPYRLTRWHQARREAYVLRNVDAMNAISEGPAAMLRARGFARPIWVQEGTGVDERTWYPDANAGLVERRRRGLQGFVVGFVGALAEGKGLLDLVAATSRLSDDWRLLLVGAGPLQPSIETLAQDLGVRDRVHLAGYVPRRETPALYRCMDVLVLPSHTTATIKEQFGVVLVEAMLSGVPVIGSDSGAIPEVIGGAGLVLPEGDVAALAGALERLQAQPSLREEMAKRGRQRALDKYCLTAMARQSYEFFVQLLTERRHTRVPEVVNG